MFGEKNGMFGKHHSEETKKRISDKLKGRIITEEAKVKIGNFHRGKIYSEETKEKISKSKRKTRHIENIHTKESWDMSITEFCKLFPDLNINPTSMRKAADCGYIYKKTFKITEYAASASNGSWKIGWNGKTLEVGNSVGSVGI